MYVSFHENIGINNYKFIYIESENYPFIIYKMTRIF